MITRRLFVSLPVALSVIVNPVKRVAMYEWVDGDMWKDHDIVSTDHLMCMLLVQRKSA